MSTLVTLLAKLKEAGVERVVFAPNELAYGYTGDSRRPIAGSPIKGAVILEAVSELLSQDDITGLSTTRPRIVRHEHDGEEYVLEIVRQGTGISLGARLAAAKAGRQTLRRDEPKAAEAPKPEPAPPPPPPKSDPKDRPTGSIRRNSRKMRAMDAEPPELDLGSRVPIQPKIDPKIAETQQALKRPTPEETSRAVTASRDELTQIAREAGREAGREAARDAAREAAREVAREVAAEAAREPAREAAREVARDVAREVMRDVQRSSPQGGGAAGAAAAVAATPFEVERPRTGSARIDGLLREMLQKRASDLHLTSDARPVFRIDGEIHFASSVRPMESADILSMVQEIMTARARHDFESLHDADFAYEIPGLARFRVNVFQDRHGTGTVLRQIPIEIQTAEKLGLPKACLDMCWLSKGLVLVTGPTGSGKSTTLAAMVDFINKNRSDHIITIEDPVEFVHQNQKCLVNQREVGQHTKSFKNALRAALREDPDIVLVGEMRDLETISIAIETAETGHLVFGTLHTTTAISTVDRIIDQFPADRQDQIRVMLSESLKGVVAQVLLPKVGGGRVAAHEILIGTTAVAAMIREGKTFQLGSTMQTSKQLGMVTMNDALMNLVMKKLVEPKQAYIKAVDKNGFLTMLRSAGIQPPI